MFSPNRRHHFICMLSFLQDAYGSIHGSPQLAAPVVFYQNSQSREGHGSPDTSHKDSQHHLLFISRLYYMKMSAPITTGFHVAPFSNCSFYFLPTHPSASCFSVYKGFFFVNVQPPPHSPPAPLL